MISLVDLREKNSYSTEGEKSAKESKEPSIFSGRNDSAICPVPFADPLDSSFIPTHRLFFPFSQELFLCSGRRIDAEKNRKKREKGRERTKGPSKVWLAFSKRVAASTLAYAYNKHARGIASRLSRPYVRSVLVYVHVFMYVNTYA